MSQVYLAEHRGSTNWGTQRKTSWSRVENQQTQPTYDVRSGNRTRVILVEGQCSHHCANTAPCSVNPWSTIIIIIITIKVVFLEIVST